MKKANNEREPFVISTEKLYGCVCFFSPFGQMDQFDQFARGFMIYAIFFFPLEHTHTKPQQFHYTNY